MDRKFDSIITRIRRLRSDLDELASNPGGGGGGGTGDVVGPASAVNNDLAAFDTASGKLIKDSGLQADTDGTLAANSDAKLPTQKAVKSYAQPLDPDLTTIAGFTPSNDDIIQRKVGAWVVRSMAQLRTDLAINNVDNTSDANKPISTATQTALDAKLDDSQKGVAGGLAELDGSGLVPSAQLPAYVDDVVTAANFAALPGTGETGKIYVTLDTNLTYRWNGSGYTEISASLALGETSSTAYRGDRGKAAYDHSLLTSGNPHSVTKSEVGLGNVTNDAQLKAADKDTDVTLAADSDAKIPSQHAVKSYVDSSVAGAGGGDLSSDTATSVDGEIALFKSTTGKLVKRATGSGIAHIAAGVLSVSNVVESEITLADNTTNNASTSAHGFLKKLSNTASEFMNGAGNWVNPMTVLSNPYKFRARRTSALSTTAGSFIKLTFNTEDFDTNSNYDNATNFRYTAPVAGFFLFNAYANAAPGTLILTLYKNGAAYQRGTQTGNGGANTTWFVQSAASDYWEIFIFGTNAVAIDVGAGIQPCFEGVLQSIT